MRLIPVVSLAILCGCVVPAARQSTPLALAARNGDVGTIGDLIARGADPNEPSGVNDWTPLMHAIHKRQLASVQALLEHGADVNRAIAHGETPLMMAAGYGYTDIVRLLFVRGADVRAKDNNGENAVDWALAGMNDLDRMTFFDCQDATVRALAATGVRANKDSSLNWAKFKRCRSVALLR